MDFACSLEVEEENERWVGKREAIQQVCQFE
jgi:hypothetical protein